MELIKYIVSDCTFHIPTSMKDGVWKQAFKEKGQTVPSSSDVYQLEDIKYKEKLRKQQDTKQVYLSPSWTIDQVSKLITGHNPFNIARQYAHEDLENAGLSKLNEYENAISSVETRIKSQAIEDKDLRKWLGVATKEFLDAILISLDASQEIDNAFLSKKRTEIFNLLKEQPNNRVIAQIKHFAQQVDEGNKLIKEAKEEVNQAYEDHYQLYKDAKDNLKEARENLQSDTSNIVKYIAYELDEQNQQLYENHSQALEKERQKKKREKARFQKLLSFSEGVALASIDGFAPQYIQAAQEIGNQVMKASNDIIAGHQTQSVEAGSEEQTMLVVKATKKVANDLIKQRANNNFLSVQKSLSESPTPEVNVMNNVSHVQRNGNSTNGSNGKVPQTVNSL